MLNDVAQNLAGENTQKICPYLALNSSNLKTGSTFAL